MKAQTTLAGAILRAAVVVGLVFSIVWPAGAQMPAIKAKVASAKSQTTAAKPTGGQQEGIKVHGHWTIVVRDADGKEVTRREFENALTDYGKGALALLLAKQMAIQEWMVQLIDANGPGVACGILLEPTSTQSGVPVSFKTLTVTSIPVGAGNERTVQLKGDLRAPSACDIGRVDTAIFASGTGSGSGFTSASVTPPVSVTANRFIEVTVVFSFS